MIDPVPLIGRVQDQLSGSKDTDLLSITSRLRYELASSRETCPSYSELSQGGPNSDLRGVGIFVFRQSVQRRFTRKPSQESR